jgi:hypothetical protein
MMEAAHTSETSVDIQLRTRQYIPEDSELHTRRRENLKTRFVHVVHVDGKRLVSELRTPTGIFFIPQMKNEYGEPQ